MPTTNITGQELSGYCGNLNLTGVTAGKWLLVTFPTRPSFSAANRKRSDDLSHIRTPLIREFLFYRSGRLLLKSSGGGLCVAREPHLPRSHASCVSTINVKI